MNIQLTQFIKPVIFTLIGVVITLLFFRGCNSPQPQINLQPLKNTLIKNFMQKDKEAFLAQANANEYKSIADSLSKLKRKVITRYVELKNIAPKDTIIMEIIASCDSLNEINNNIIFAKDSVIESLETVISIKNYQIENIKSQMQIGDLELKTQRKSLKKQKLTTFIVAFIGASATAYLLTK